MTFFPIFLMLIARFVLAVPTLKSRDVCDYGVNSLAVWLANFAPMLSFCPADGLPVQDDGPIVRMPITTVKTVTQFSTVATTYAYATTVAQPFKKAKRQDYQSSNGGGLDVGGLVNMFIQPLFNIVPSACSCLSRSVVSMPTRTETRMEAVTTVAATATSTLPAQVVVPLCATGAPFLSQQWQTCRYTAQCGALIALRSDGIQIFGNQDPLNYPPTGLAVRTTAPTFLDCWQVCVTAQYQEPSGECVAFSFGLTEGICDTFSSALGFTSQQYSVSAKQEIGWAWANIEMGVADGAQGMSC